MTATRRSPAWPLAVAAGVEALSLTILLINLATGNDQAVAAAVGPLHGTAYLVAIALTWTGGYQVRARWLSLIPGVGALLFAVLTGGRFTSRRRPEPPSRRAPAAE